MVQRELHMLTLDVAQHALASIFDQIQHMFKALVSAVIGVSIS